MEQKDINQSPPELVLDNDPAPIPPVVPAPEPPASSEPEHVPTPPKGLKQIHHRLIANKKLLAVAILVVLLIAGAAAYWFLLRDSGKSVSSSTKTQSTSNIAKTKKPSLPAANLINGNTYLDTAKDLGDLQFFKNTDIFGTSCTDQNNTNCEPTIKSTDISYRQIGTTSDGKIIVVFSAGGGFEGFTDFALGNTDSSYDILAQMDKGVADQQADWKKSLADNVNINQVLKLNDINFPNTVTVNGQNLKASNNPSDSKTIAEADSIFMVNGLPSIRGIYRGDLQGITPQKITDKDGLTYYRVAVTDEDTFQVVEIYATYKNLFSMSYDPAGEIASASGNLAISWTQGEKNSSGYFSGGGGCSTSGYVVAKNVVSSDLVPVGKTPKGQAIYQLSTSHPLSQEIFNKDYAAGQYLDDKTLQNLTIQQMTDKHAYFLSQNGFNEYVLFQRDDMFPRGGCAKPVIYLYPQQTTNVSVKVGAQVVKSAPQYGNEGWQNVIAQPDGRLSYSGKNYPSLYWEGYGNGSYPNIDSGTIVKSVDTANTVKTQLAQQGLNSKEISDFMSFWGPKLATNKPYTRLSWLNTADMNQLAPLNISPAPRTTIRVFLDFEGLDKPSNLPAQKLSAPKRLGFTVVEWGGLLRNGLN